MAASNMNDLDGVACVRATRDAWLAGPSRQCQIGLARLAALLQVLLAVLVRQYNWQLSAPAALRWRHFPMPSPLDGMPVSFSRRSDPLL